VDYAPFFLLSFPWAAGVPEESFLPPFWQKPGETVSHVPQPADPSRILPSFLFSTFHQPVISKDKL